MMNNETLANIEYLREKANVTYEEAEQLLIRYDGNVMRALVELEHQGRVYAQEPTGEMPRSERKDYDPRAEDEIKKAKTFARKAMRTRLVVERKDGDATDRIAALPVPLAVIFGISAPWVAVGAAAIGIVTGCTARIEKSAEETKAE